MTLKSSLMLSGLLLWAATGRAGEIRPQGVSPGAGGPVSLIESRCPTFSWSLVPGARAYELAVFEVNPELLEGEASNVETGESRFRVRLPGMAVSWTPSVGQCLEPGGQYAWFVRALADEWSEWSEARVFEVDPGPSIAEVEEALRVLRRYTGTRQDGLGGEKAPAEPDRPRQRSARRRGLEEREGSKGLRSGPGAAASRERQVRPGEAMMAGARNEVAQEIQGEPVWSPSHESGATEAAAPTLGAPSLTLDGDISLAGSSSVFKDGEVFLWDDTTGNTALGREALASAGEEATNNTAVGRVALYSNTTGGRNTASGAKALYSNTTGSRNTASGFLALSENTHGSDNTAVGDKALRSNTVGFRNTASGNYALFSNLNGSGNTASGFLALAYNTTGSHNTAMGREALYSNTNADGNTAFGAFALASNTEGYGNTAMGREALMMNSKGQSHPYHGSNNTAVGDEAMRANTNGGSNTAVGSGALAANTTGWESTALGDGALGLHPESWQNTAVGSGALFYSTTGGFNTAIGTWALSYNTDGSWNTAVGTSALLRGTTGSRNTAVGLSALENATGSRNVAIGDRAGYSSTTGDDNIFIGSEGTSTDDTVIRIGTPGTHSNTFIAGIRGTTTDVADAIPVLIDSNGQLGTVSSSRRLKEDIRDMAAASDRLLELRPVTFRYRRHAGSDESRLQYGLIAEEVAETFPELVVSSEDGRPETVLYHLMTAMLVNELKRQHERVEAQEDQLADQRRELERLRARMARLEGAEGGLGLMRTKGYTVPTRPPDSSGR